VGFCNYSVRLEGPGQVVGDLDTYKPEALDHFCFVPTDVGTAMPSTMLSEVDDYLLFVVIEGVIIVVAPVHQILYPFPVLCLIIV